MDTNSWAWLLAAGLVVGLAGGAWLAARMSRTRHHRALRRATRGMEHKLGELSEQLRAVPARSQTDIEQLRQTHQREMKALNAEPDAAVARAEQRLLAAYEELDRMRHQLMGAHAPTEPAALGDGFAPTQPFPRQM